MSTTTILLADDHPIFRNGLRLLIDRRPGFRVIAEAGNGRLALELMAADPPAVAVLDLDKPELDGFAVAQRARELGLSSHIVIFTMHRDMRHLEQAIDLGVRGYLVKDGATAEVIDCIRTGAAGGEYISPALSSHLARRSRGQVTPTEPSGVTFTATERRVLALLAELKTTKQIAAELGVSPRTIDNHRAHICAKLDLQGPHALAKFAREHRHLWT